MLPDTTRHWVPDQLLGWQQLLSPQSLGTSARRRELRVPASAERRVCIVVMVVAYGHRAMAVVAAVVLGHHRPGRAPTQPALQWMAC